ncbi:LOW QUALITY PROTEIN: receptor-type guanylate cyclase gcy-23-like [Pecten maximus]|uniref:LOW QUALITY PROTEIN: receptor-type guanylate cyclase gcy-23-like n=1 Tax=Pecten maximus TaxID=6579 RepID=UPI001458337E|nr:LOW QUALITY PROTEIN: receptor-type guanylate cyclase gcy-23-like [Pecten maximus]
MNTSRNVSFGISNEVAVSTGCCAEGCKYNILSSQGRRFQITKILALALFPIIVLSVIASISVIDNAAELSLKEDIQKGIKFSLETGILLRFTQIERGMSTLYLSSQSDTQAYLTLMEKYSLTDRIINNLSQWPPLAVGNPPHFQSKASYFENIKQYRNRVISDNITIEDVINKYTNDNGVIIGWVATYIRLYTTGKLWMNLVAYYMLLLGSDEIGLERALGSTYFTTGVLPHKQSALYIEKKVTAERYLEISKSYSDEVRRLTETYLDNTELYRTLNDMRTKIIMNQNITTSAYSSIQWFDNMTSYIDIMMDIKDTIAQNIVNSLQQELDAVSVNYQWSIGLLIATLLLYPYNFSCGVQLTKQIQLVALSFKEKASSLSNERKRSEALLCQLLPISVAKKMMENEKVEPRLYSSATVCFSDIVGFTTICSGCTPFQVVELLNSLYNTFDSRLEKYDVYKVETIGDAYMVVSGVPETNGERHVCEISYLALDLRDATQKIDVRHLSGKNISLRIRIGVNTGPVVSGIVGIKMPRYCLFGDTVNVASRMESTGKPQMIQISATTLDALEKYPCFQTQERGYVEIKGKGEMKTFWLLRSTVPNVHLQRLDKSTARHFSSPVNSQHSDYENV